MGIIDIIKKRRTSASNNSNSVFSGAFGFKLITAYDNETTWIDLYRNEPFIRGPIDAIVNAIIGEWSIESMSKNPSEKEKKLIERITNDLSLPRKRVTIKLRTMAYKLLIDTVNFIETSRDMMDFYVLNSDECQLKWSEGNKWIEGFYWKMPNSSAKPVLLSDKSYAFGSLFDPDTNLFKNSPMETLIDIGNLLYSARHYNLNIFKSGGFPSSLIVFDPSTSDEVVKNFIRDVKTLKNGENVVVKAKVDIKQLAGFTKDMEYDVLVDYAFKSIMTLLNFTPMTSYQSSGGGGESSKQEMNAFATGIHAKQKVINDVMTQVIHNLYSEEDESDDIFRISSGRKKASVYNLRFKLKKWVDARQLSAIHKIYLDGQILTRNEVREEIGREKLEEAEGFLERGLGPMGNIGSENPSGQDRENDPEMDDDDRNRPSDIQDVES